MGKPAAPRVLPSLRVMSHDPLDEPEVRALTRKFLEVRRSSHRLHVGATIECGQILAEGREKWLGIYQRWLRERLHLAPGTASKMVALAQWYQKEPLVVRRWKELGVDRLFGLAKLAVPIRKRALANPEVLTMTTRAFRHWTVRQRRTRRVTSGNVLAAHLRHSIRSFHMRLAELRVPRVTNPDTRRKVRESIRELSRYLGVLMARL